MNSPLPPSVRMWQLSMGSWITQTLSAVASLGVADVMSEEPRPIAELAEAVGADHDALYRVMRALADVDVFRAHEDRGFALTELGRLLRTDEPGSVRDWLALVGHPAWRAFWSDLATTVRTGEPAFERVHGASTFEYLRAHPEAASVFNAAMTNISQGTMAAIVDAYDFTGLNTVVDVGGGNGALLAALVSANPHLEGTLFDLPEVTAGADAQYKAAGVGNRCRSVSGDFFTSIPDGGDAYLLSNIVHDWDDERATRILANCRAAMGDSGRVLVAEHVVPEANQPPDANQPSVAKWVDLEMLLVGGRQRTKTEHAALFASAGLRLSRVVPAGPVSVVEALPDQHR